MRIKMPRRMSTRQTGLCETLVQLSQAMTRDDRYSNWQQAARQAGVEGSAGINSLLIDIGRNFEEVWKAYEKYEPNWYESISEVAHWLLDRHSFEELHDQQLVAARLSTCIVNNIEQINRS